MTKTTHKFLAVVFVAVLLADGVYAKEAASAPEPELLEFLGTFEKDGCSGVDPYLSGKPGASEDRTPSGVEKKKDRRSKSKGKIREKESVDE
ncbi:MAG: hypothetical protein NTV99_07415 [Deltaproteobacteria bacterium]|nr:hypothetical protein [Deltaproteobacteria bacterium]